MLHKRRSFGTRKVSPPQPTCMTDDQKATYLRSLRNDKPARPTGARPLPARPSMSKVNEEFCTQDNDQVISTRGETLGTSKSRHHDIPTPSATSVANVKGRPLVMAPGGGPTGRKVTPPEIRYRESALRQKEKFEAHSLRKALAQVDSQDEESRIHKAAQLEAADLVWQHRNPEMAEQEKQAPYRNPDILKKRYVLNTDGSALDHTGESNAHRSFSKSSAEASGKKVEYPNSSTQRSFRLSGQWTTRKESGSKRNSSGSRKISSGSSKGLFRNPNDEIYEEPQQVEKPNMQDTGSFQPLKTRTQNPANRGFRPLPEKPTSLSSLSHSRVGQATSQNSPSQSRDPYFRDGPSSRSQTPEENQTARTRILEIRSEEIRAATSMRRSDRSPKLPTPTAVSDKLGRPIVSFDPSWKPTEKPLHGNDNTEGLLRRPLPTKPHRSTLQDESSGQARLSHGTREKRSENVSSATIPTINLPGEEGGKGREELNRQQSSSSPSIAISAPEIAISEPPTSDKRLSNSSLSIKQNATIGQDAPSILVSSDCNKNLVKDECRAAPKHSPLTGIDRVDKRVPWLSRHQTAPSIGGSQAVSVACSACQLPISGRIVTAAGASNKHKARFHPECFTCFRCSAELECVSFYPEPESSRLERLGQHFGHDVDVATLDVGPTFEQADLRFYCHLDYHDMFSPRCGSCHTPIEGAVILAAGKSWHEGHFFCAECGDPFSSTSPFVESQGYAYCVGCHTKRTSARCKACKKQILDDVTVEALGGKWHEECFRCDECGNDFGEEGKFFVREVDLELTEKEKRKGLTYRKVEERAVCDECEARRLKSKDVAAFL